MKKYLLLILFMSLLYWSCEEEVAEVLPEDCLGIEGGIALVDSCGVCDSDPTNDCTEDCSGQWGGTLVVDCNGECGGTALVDSCGICANYPSINIIAPDSITRSEGNNIIFYLINIEINNDLTDEELIGSIDYVGFSSFSVTNDSIMNNGNLIYLYDDGSANIIYEPDITSGDTEAGDGVFSINIPVFGVESQQTIPGVYNWNFIVKYACIELGPFIHTITIN